MSAPDAAAPSLLRGAGLMLPATLVGSVLLLGVDAWANAHLSLADYGLYGAIRRFVQIAGFVVLLGMENAVIRAVARAPDADAARASVRTAVGATATVGSLLAAGLYATAPWIAARIDPAEGTVTALRIAAVALPLWGVRTVAVAACQGWGSLLPRALVTFIVWPLLQLAGLWLFVGSWGLAGAGAVAAFTLAVALGAGQGLWHLHRMRPALLAPLRDPGEGALGAMLAVSWPLWLHGVSMALYTWWDQVLLADLLGPREAGLYGPVAQLAPLFGLGLGALNSAFAPIIARRHAEGDAAGLAAHYRLVTRWAVLIAVPAVALAVAVPMSVLAPWTRASAETALALQITAVAQLLCTAVGSVNYLLIMSGRPRDPLYNAIPAVVVSLGASLVLIPRFGVAGAALANGLAMGVANVGGLVQVHRHLGMHPFHLGMAKPIVAGVVVIAVALAARATFGDGWTTLAVGAGVGGGLFLATVGALGLDEGDRAVLAVFRTRVGR
ncbi:MAG: hypothetical protein EXR71_10360 [Myxococcales bacterium]|nr:hypothetical protein [Myxococcales bacterium]